MHTNQINCLSRDPALFANHRISLKKNGIFLARQTISIFVSSRIQKEKEKKVQRDEVFLKKFIFRWFLILFSFQLRFVCVFIKCKVKRIHSCVFICSLVRGLVHYLVSVALFSVYTMKLKPYRIKRSKCCSIMDW